MADAAEPKKRGGARPGAGRKPKAAPALPTTEDPVTWLLAAMNDPSVSMALRVRAASSAAQYLKPKVPAQQAPGKKEVAQQRSAEVVQKTRFAPGRPPLRSVS